MKTETSHESSEDMRSDLDDLAQWVREAGFLSGAGTATLRLRLGELEANANTNGCRGLARCLNQLAGLTELVECAQDQAQADTVAAAEAFTKHAIQRLAETRDDSERELVASELAVRFEQEFREYLGLVDSAEADFSETDPTSFDVNHEPETDFEPARLLRMFGLESDPAEAIPAEVEPEPPARCPAEEVITRSVESNRGDSSELDAIPAELRTIFLGEAVDLRDRIEAHVLRVDRNPDDLDSRRELARCFHTLKGTSASIGLATLSRRVHDLEDLLSDPACPITGQLRGRLSSELDHLDSLIGGSVSRPAPPTARLDAAVSTMPVEGLEPFIRIRREQMERIQSLLADLIGRRHVWTDQIDALRNLVNTGRSMLGRFSKERSRLREMESSHRGRDRGHERGSQSEDRAWSELVEDFTVMIEAIREVVTPLSDESNALTRLSTALWDGLQEVRIVPVAGLFRRLERVARDASRTEGRDLEITSRGEGTQIDRSAQEPVFEALLHVVRNAVVHGIEAANDRSRAGKPERGRVTFAARREGSTLHLSIVDDGRGLNYDRIASRGRELGLLGRDEAPDPARLHQLIFTPGFSTCDEANALAGRGVGMDVVAQTLTRLGGTIAIDSTAGRGTCFHLRFPAAFALEHVLVVRVGGQPFALPFDVIERIEPLEPGSTTEPIAEEPCRRVELRAVLGFPAAGARSRPKLVIVASDRERIGVVVDAIDGHRELMVQPPGSLWSEQQRITGTSTLTSGEIVLHLSISNLAAESLKVIPLVPEPAEVGERGRIALVVDDSISVRRQGAKLLRDQGFEIEEATNGMDALRFLGIKQFDLILTDLDMPRMDGFELLGEVRRRRLDATRVIVASTRDDHETRRRVLEAGALALLGKPLTHTALADVIASAFS